jgi:hypothetical protein
MRIGALRLYNVKRFAGRGVALEGIGAGVNVLCAANEYGKSTSFEALHALFFQPHGSGGKDVKRLQPYGGGNPLIEADIETEEGRFRIAKQFIGRRSATVTDLERGRIVAQADEAEAFIAGLVGSGTAGPAGLLWVRQGITGIEDRDRREEEGERRIRESLLTSVQGEVEAVTGGRRMAQILDAVAAELGELVTPTGRPRAGSPYDAAIREEAELRDREKRLDAEVSRLREALDRRAGLLRQLAAAEDEDEVAARRTALADAEAQHEAVRRHGEALKSARSALALARNERDAAEKALADLRGHAGRAEALRRELDTARMAREAALARRDRAAAALAAAADAVSAAESEEREARDLLNRLERALQAREAAEARAALEERLRQAEDLRKAIEKAEAALALVALPDKAVDTLQQLEIELAGLRATRQAGLPSLSVAYAPGIVGAVRLAGRALAEGEEHALPERAELEIAGVGTLTLRASRPAGADDRLRELERRQAEMLLTLGVAGLTQARQKQAAAQDQGRELDRLRLTLSHLAPEGLARLREAVAAAAEPPPEAPDAAADPEAARIGLEEAARAMDVARNARHELEPERSRAEAGLVAAETALARLEVELEAEDAALGPEEGRAGRLRALVEGLDAARSAVALAEALVEALSGAGDDLEAAEAALARARSAIRAAEERAGRLHRELAELSGQIRTRAEDAVEEEWQEARDRLAEASLRVSRFAAEVAALERLRAALQAARARARDLYLKPVIGELKPLLRLLFEDVEIRFSEETLLPESISRNGQDEDVERLSGGMREQLSVLTRLAFARLLARDGRPAPVILDDALVYSDDDRIERMFDALHRQARDQQIIVFSCRQRAFARLGGNVLEMTPWTPDAG